MVLDPLSESLASKKQKSCSRNQLNGVNGNVLTDPDAQANPQSRSQGQSCNAASEDPSRFVLCSQYQSCQKRFITNSRYCDSGKCSCETCHSTTLIKSNYTKRFCLNCCIRQHIGTKGLVQSTLLLPMRQAERCPGLFTFVKVRPMR